MANMDRVDDVRWQFPMRRKTGRVQVNDGSIVGCCWHRIKEDSKSTRLYSMLKMHISGYDGAMHIL